MTQTLTGSSTTSPQNCLLLHSVVFCDILTIAPVSGYNMTVSYQIQLFQKVCHQKFPVRSDSRVLSRLNTEESKSIQHSQVWQPSPVAVRDDRVHLSDNVVFTETKRRVEVSSCLKQKGTVTHKWEQVKSILAVLIVGSVDVSLLLCCQWVKQTSLPSQ